MAKNTQAKRLTATRKSNVKNVQLTANFNELVAFGKDQCTKVYFELEHISFSNTNNRTIFISVFTAPEHEENCLHPKKTGAEVMQALQASETQLNEERKLFSTLIELLSYEKIIFNGE